MGSNVLAAGLWSVFSVVPTLHIVQSRVEPIEESSEKYRAVFAFFRQIADSQADIGEMIEQAHW
jgi:hypothetical protein